MSDIGPHEYRPMPTVPGVLEDVCVFCGLIKRNCELSYKPREYQPIPDLKERDHILNTAKALISGDRNKTYGDAREDFTRTGRMWAVVLGLDTITPEQVALCMALVKVSRLCETPTHHDGWVDLCGYAALGGEIATT